MSVRRTTAPFDRRDHDVSGFSCGEPALDSWLRRYAGQNQRRDAARTFVLARSDRSIAGYYTLVVGHVEHDAATPHVAAGLSARFPVPVCIIARLAIDNTAQGRGLGAGLVLDALQRVLAASELVGIRAVVVHALHDRAAHFYTQFGFEPVGDDPRTLMVPLQAVRAVLGDGRA